VHNLRVQPAVELRDLTVVQPMRVREVEDEAERARLWALAVAAFPPYAEYQATAYRADSEWPHAWCADAPYLQTRLDGDPSSCQPQAPAAG